MIRLGEIIDNVTNVEVTRRDNDRYDQYMVREGIYFSRSCAEESKYIVTIPSSLECPSFLS